MDWARYRNIAADFGVYKADVVRLVRSFAGSIGFPQSDERLEIRNALVSLVTGLVRELLLLLPDDSARMDVMIGAAVCIDCGKDNGEMYERRKFYMCSYKEHDG